MRALFCSCGAWGMLFLLRCGGLSLQWLLLLQSTALGRVVCNSWGTWAQQVWLPGSRALAQELSRTGSLAPQHVGSSRGLFSGKITGAGFHFLLQGIFLTQGSNLYLLRWQAISLPLGQRRSLVVILLLWSSAATRVFSFSASWPIPAV